MLQRVEQVSENALNFKSVHTVTHTNHIIHVFYMTILALPETRRIRAAGAHPVLPILPRGRPPQARRHLLDHSLVKQKSGGAINVARRVQKLAKRRQKCRQSSVQTVATAPFFHRGSQGARHARFQPGRCSLGRAVFAHNDIMSANGTRHASPHLLWLVVYASCGRPIWT